MNILIAPNSMKNSLTAFQFADAVEKAFLKANQNFNVKKIPIADGGDLTGEILAESFNAKKVNVEVQNAYGKIINSQIYVKEDLAIIEMADASGMKNCNVSKLNPLIASSYGTGQLINKAISLGLKRVYLGVGGSATVDGGVGMMKALGYKFFNKNNEELKDFSTNLNEIAFIREPGNSIELEITIITDVNNPLLGENGAANVFGYQKGATNKETIKILEEGLSNWAQILSNYKSEKFIDTEGFGAAGGIAVPLVTLFNAKIVEGADFILDLLSINEAIKWSNVIITGEGSIDAQTNNNKAPMALARRALYFNKPILGIAGQVDIDSNNFFDGVFSITNGPMSLEKSMRNAKELVFGTAFEIAKVISKLKLNA